MMMKPRHRQGLSEATEEMDNMRVCLVTGCRVVMHRVKKSSKVILELCLVLSKSEKTNAKDELKVPQGSTRIKVL